MTLTNILPTLLVTPAGDTIFKWFMKMSKACRKLAKYNWYHAELSIFLKLPKTQKALGKECIDAIIKMKLSLRDKENKLARYVCH